MVIDDSDGFVVVPHGSVAEEYITAAKSAVLEALALWGFSGPLPQIDISTGKIKSKEGEEYPACYGIPDEKYPHGVVRLGLDYAEKHSMRQKGLSLEQAIAVCAAHEAGHHVQAYHNDPRLPEITGIDVKTRNVEMKGHPLEEAANMVVEGVIRNLYGIDIVYTELTGDFEEVRSARLKLFGTLELPPITYPFVPLPLSHVLGRCHRDAERGKRTGEGRFPGAHPYPT